MNIAFFIHGYNSNADEMAASCDFLRLQDSFTCISLESPFPCDLNKEKRQWFRLSYLNTFLTECIREQAAAVHKIITEKLSEFAESDIESVVVIGHSQGAMLAAFLNIFYPLKSARCICVSGMVPFTEMLPEDIKQESPLLFIHGEDDTMIPIARLKADIELLKLKGIESKLIGIKGAGHSIDKEMSGKIFEAVKNQL